MFGALALNFVMMAQLSLHIARIPWNGFWRAHVPALKLAAVSGVASVVAALAFRNYGAPAIGVLVGSGAVTLVWTLLFVWRQSESLLGEDGQWMLERLKSLLRANLARRSQQAEVS